MSSERCPYCKSLLMEGEPRCWNCDAEIEPAKEATSSESYPDIPVLEQPPPSGRPGAHEREVLQPEKNAGDGGHLRPQPNLSAQSQKPLIRLLVKFVLLGNLIVFAGVAVWVVLFASGEKEGSHRSAVRPTRKHRDIAAVKTLAPRPVPRDDVQRVEGVEVSARPALPPDHQPLPPKPLTRAQIRKAMSGVIPAARQCHARYRDTGGVRARITYSGAGRVTAVVLKGSLAQTPTGRCVGRLMKQIVFPKSKGGTFAYPFVFK